MCGQLMHVSAQKSARTTWPRSSAATPGEGICGRSMTLAKRPECRANLFCKELRLLPGREVAALAGLVEVDEVVIRALGPAARGLIDLAGKDAHGSRDGDVHRVQVRGVSSPSRLARLRSRCW